MKKECCHTSQNIFHEIYEIYENWVRDIFTNANLISQGETSNEVTCRL